jgi:hypothetical protein
MKPLQCLFRTTVLSLISCAFVAHGQADLIYDQQSSTDESSFPFGAGGAIQQAILPWGQSFTPSLPAVDFIQLNVNDSNPSNGLGVTLLVNLRTVSVGGPILASTLPTTLTNGFSGVAHFAFASTVALIPGSVIFFEPVVQSGDLWNIIAAEYNYPSGTAFFGGLPATGSDFWFREGIIVPEPSAAWLYMVGAVFLAWSRLDIRSRNGSS